MSEQTISDSLQIRHGIAVLNQIKEGEDKTSNRMRTFYELSDDALWSIYTTNIQEYMTLTTKKSTKNPPKRRPSQDYFETPGVPKRAKGMTNIGNTCFFNSATKCLYAITPLTKFFLDNQQKIQEDLKIRKADIWTDQEFTDEEKLTYQKRIDTIESYINIIQKFQENRELLADDLRDQVPQMCTIIFNKEFDYQQQDAGEVIVKLLEFIHFAWYEQNLKNPINQLSSFNDLMVTKGKDGFCKSLYTERAELQLTLQLPINPYYYPSEKQVIKLETLLNVYFSGSEPDDYKCEEKDDPDQNKKGTVIRLRRLENCPEFLIIIPKRNAYQQYDLNDMRKVQNPVDYPHQLDMKSYLPQKTSTKLTYQNVSQYDLIAVAYHRGQTVNGGHWLAKTKHQDQWYLHDDSFTGTISKEEVIDERDGFCPVERKPADPLLKCVPLSSILIYQRKDARKTLPYHPPEKPKQDKN